jgi:hypothetical protein
MISRRRFFQSAATGALTVLTARSLFAESPTNPAESVGGLARTPAGCVQGSIRFPPRRLDTAPVMAN